MHIQGCNAQEDGKLNSLRKYQFEKIFSIYTVARLGRIAHSLSEGWSASLSVGIMGDQLSASLNPAYDRVAVMVREV